MYYSFDLMIVKMSCVKHPDFEVCNIWSYMTILWQNKFILYINKIYDTSKSAIFYICIKYIVWCYTTVQQTLNI